MAESEPNHANLTKAEQALVQQIADRDGISLDEAATKLGQRYLARTLKKRTGKAPARIYSLKRKS